MTKATDTKARPAWVEDYPEYEAMVRSWGHEVIHFDTLGSYQGDHVVILGDGDRRGWLVIGYGSCSGCDALEAAVPTWNADDPDADWTAVHDLADRLRNDIRWHDTASALADYLASAEERSEFWLYESGAKELRDRLVTDLRGEAQ